MEMTAQEYYKYQEPFANIGVSSDDDMQPHWHVSTRKKIDQDFKTKAAEAAEINLLLNPIE
ncbi:MAG TPA: hypothetical protein VIK28_09865 [Sedimentisphaerales bacterium]